MYRTLGPAALAALCLTIPVASAQDTTFVYRGELMQAGVPVDDACEMTFSLWNDATDGVQQGDSVVLTDVEIVDGVFKAELDFGVDALAGAGHWLEIAVECPGDEAPVTLTPRQVLRPTPAAIFAQAASESFRVYDENKNAWLQLFAEVDEGVADGGLEMTSSQGKMTEIAAGDVCMFLGTGDDAPPIAQMVANAGTGGLVEVSHANGMQGARLSPNGLLLRHSNGEMSVGISNGEIYADAVFAPVKHFRIPNPVDPTTDLVYACPEGPEAAAYIRGTGRLVEGRAVVELPAHFRSVASSVGMTVTLTPRSADSLGLAVVERSGDRFVVRELLHGTGTYEFDFYVMAVRRGYEQFQVVRPNRAPASKPAGPAE